MAEKPTTRRPLKTRDTKWAAATAAFLARAGARPNQISLASVFFAAVTFAAFKATSNASVAAATACFILAAAGIQLRLLCNLFDGMVAVEGGFKTKSGEIYNELPDRFADVLILVGAGYSRGSDETMVLAGWIAGVAAVITAYVRALGAFAGAAQHFVGPMAKPHRMATMTIASLLAAVFVQHDWSIPIVSVALWVVVAGCGVTIIRRCRRIVRDLEAK